MEQFGPVVVRKTIAAPITEVWQQLATGTSWWPVQLTPELGATVRAPATEQFG